VSNLSLLATPENERWDFGSIRHIRQYYSDDYTPISAVDSIFELPCDGAFGSPNSSNHSSFIAELEDTSPIVLAKFSPHISSDKSPVFPQITAQPTILNPRMEFKTADINASSRVYPFHSPKANSVQSRAVIKVVDETIAAIEDTNRKLLSRAVAAEEAAKSAEEAARSLREQNSLLQLKIKQYSENQERPKTAPSQPRRTRYKYTPIGGSGPTPLSTFNTSIDQLVLNKPQPTKPTRPAQPIYPPRHTAPSSLPLSPPAHIDIAPGDPFKMHNFPSPTPKQNRPPPLPLKSHSRCHSHTLEISKPIPGSVTRHEVTYDGIPLIYGARAKNISLDEARRRAKPLPPLGPTTPSVVQGVVEIGVGGLDPLSWDREGMEERDKKKGGFSALFCRRRGRQNVKVF
jgi:hypothetical protein